MTDSSALLFLFVCLKFTFILSVSVDKVEENAFESLFVTGERVV